MTINALKTPLLRGAHIPFGLRIIVAELAVPDWSTDQFYGRIGAHIHIAWSRDL